VLEGIGLIEKRAKNNIVWKGSLDPRLSSVSAVGDPKEARIRDSLVKVRAKIEHYYNEDSQLDLWTNRIKSQMKKLQEQATYNRMNDSQPLPLDFVLSDDIIQSLYYPKQPAGMRMDEDMVVPVSNAPARNPQSSVLAVHAPVDSVIELAAGSKRGKYTMSIGQKTDLEKAKTRAKRKEQEALDDSENFDPYSNATTEKSSKRKAATTPVMSPVKAARVTPTTSSSSSNQDESIAVYLMPFEFCEREQTVKSLGAKRIPQSRSALRQAGSRPAAVASSSDDHDQQDWNFANTPILEKHEGVSDFFQTPTLEAAQYEQAAPVPHYGYEYAPYPTPSAGYASPPPVYQATPPQPAAAADEPQQQ
jgi:hypothetical protein